MATYAYLGPSRVLRRTNGNGTYAAYTYDGGRQVTEVAHRQSADNALLTGFSYTYDRAGNRLSENLPHARRGGYAYDSTYAYDSLAIRSGRASSSFQPLAGSLLQYSYDAAGNRVQTSDAGPGHPLHHQRRERIPDRRQRDARLRRQRQPAPGAQDAPAPGQPPSTCRSC